MRKNLFYFAPANSVHSFRWIQYFKNNEYDITWVSFHEIQEKFLIDYPGLKIITLNKQHQQIVKGNIFQKVIGFYSAISLINNILKDKQCTIAQVHSLGLYGITMSFVSKIPFVGTAWGSDIIFVNNPIKKTLLKRVLKKANFITCDADHMVERLQNLGVAKFKLKLIYFGVEVNLYNSLNFPPKSNDNGIFTILSLRNHYEVYDIETIILAFGKFVEKVPSKLIIAGIGDRTNSYISLAQKLNISNHVEFSGRYNRDDLKRLISQSDIYISASKSDAGIAASTAECMACNLVCLISDSGENSNWISDGENGFMFETGNVDSLINKLLLVSKNRTNFNTIGTNGSKTINSRNNYLIEMKKIDNLYKELR
jgi:glycosyltransferase involved in cell wall biosynthesis